MTSIFVPFRFFDNNQYTEEELKEFCLKHSYMKMVFEISSDDKPHYHGFINENTSKKTVIYWLKSELHCKGNKDYSMATKGLENQTPQRYYQYICKGKDKDTPPTLFHNVEPEWVLENHKKYWEENKETQEKRIKIKLTVKSKLIDYIRLYAPYDYDQQIIVRILQFYKEIDTPVSFATVENYFHYVKTIIEPDYLSERAINIYNKIKKFEC